MIFDRAGERRKPREAVLGQISPELVLRVRSGLDAAEQLEDVTVSGEYHAVGLIARSADPSGLRIADLGLRIADCANLYALNASAYARGFFGAADHSEQPLAAVIVEHPIDDGALPGAGDAGEHTARRLSQRAVGVVSGD